jgi:hypothetical protein
MFRDAEQGRLEDCQRGKEDEKGEEHTPKGQTKWLQATSSQTGRDSETGGRPTERAHDHQPDAEQLRVAVRP